MSEEPEDVKPKLNLDIVFDGNRTFSPSATPIHNLTPRACRGYHQGEGKYAIQ